MELSKIRGSDQVENQQVLAYDSIHDLWLGYHQKIDLKTQTETDYANMGMPSYLSLGGSGRIWQSGVWTGAWEYDGIWNDHTSWSAGSGIAQLQEDRQGLIWYTLVFGTGTYTYDRNQHVQVNPFDPKVIRQDSWGNIWLAGTGHSANAGEVHNYQAGKWSSFTIPQLFNGSWAVSDLEIGADSTVWVGAQNVFYPNRDTVGGVLYRTPQGAWNRLGKAQGLASEDIYSLALDEHNALWIGTGRGLSRYYKGQIQNWAPSDWGIDTTDNPDGAKVWDIAVDRKGHLCIGSQGIHCSALPDLPTTTPIIQTLSGALSYQQNLHGFNFQNSGATDQWVSIYQAQGIELAKIKIPQHSIVQWNAKTSFGNQNLYVKIWDQAQ